MTPREFALAYIRRWEDGGATDPNKTHSMRRADGGNWTGGRIGFGVLVGSNHGVTSIALAKHRGVPVATITYAVMHALTVDEAADIALEGYYRGPGLDRLPWNQVTASVMDMGWGAGPFHGVQLLQRACGCSDDGNVEPGTVAAATGWFARVGIEAAAHCYAAQRYIYYDKTIAAHPEDAQFHDGWHARTDSFLPRTPWWASWGAATPAASASPAGFAPPSVAARLIAGVKRVLP